VSSSKKQRKGASCTSPSYRRFLRKSHVPGVSRPNLLPLSPAGEGRTHSSLPKFNVNAAFSSRRPFSWGYSLSAFQTRINSWE
jgi:hypothetical protein